MLGELWRQDTSRLFMALNTEFRGGKMCLNAIKTLQSCALRAAAGTFRNLVQLQPCNGSSNQGWQIRRDGEWIHLISVVSGECLDIVKRRRKERHGAGSAVRKLFGAVAN